jgi:hypothetical protein
VWPATAQNWHKRHQRKQAANAPPHRQAVCMPEYASQTNNTHTPMQSRAYRGNNAPVALHTVAEAGPIRQANLCVHAMLRLSSALLTTKRRRTCRRPACNTTLSPDQHHGWFDQSRQAAQPHCPPRTQPPAHSNRSCVAPCLAWHPNPTHPTHNITGVNPISNGCVSTKGAKPTAIISNGCVSTKGAKPQPSCSSGPFGTHGAHPQ